MMGMNGVMPQESTAMVSALNERAQGQANRIRNDESVMVPSSKINLDVPPREMGLFSRVTLGLERAVASQQHAAQSYQSNA